MVGGQKIRCKLTCSSFSLCLSLSLSLSLSIYPFHVDSGSQGNDKNLEYRTRKASLPQSTPYTADLHPYLIFPSNISSIETVQPKTHLSLYIYVCVCVHICIHTSSQHDSIASLDLAFLYHPLTTPRLPTLLNWNFAPLPSDGVGPPGPPAGSTPLGE